MPAGLIVNVNSLIQSKHSKRFALVTIVITLIVLIYLQRILGITNVNFPLYVTAFILILFAGIIFSNISVLKGSTNFYLKNVNEIFNSDNSRKFIAVFALALFIFYVYEIPEYNNQNPHKLTNLLTFGHNTFLSNRMAGVLILMVFVIFTSFVVSNS